jgi:ATP-dependent protease HslVU (ClpYQ) peptidase subunit
MSIIVSLKINDGVVMAADSATTFAIGQIYENANKIVNLIKGLPIGVMTCGSGGAGNASITTLLRICASDFRVRTRRMQTGSSTVGRTRSSRS